VYVQRAIILFLCLPPSQAIKRVVAPGRKTDPKAEDYEVDAGAVELDTPDLNDGEETDEGSGKGCKNEDEEADGEDAVYTDDEEKTMDEVEKEVMEEFKSSVDARNVQKFVPLTRHS
jgi:hypothetical protein